VLYNINKTSVYKQKLSRKYYWYRNITGSAIVITYLIYQTSNTSKEQIMRKSISNATRPATVLTNEQWLDLEQIAQVEITSETAEHPIENALLPDNQLAWYAAQAGEQVIRLIFDQPQHINRIVLNFIEMQIERTQEFVLRWSDDKGKTFHEIVRQQWNFNPASTQEIEDYQVKLANVTLLELIICPDIKGGDAHASLQKLRLA